MKKKNIFVKTVYSKRKVEDLSDEEMNKPGVQKSIIDGYHYVQTFISDGTRRALDNLYDLGYVDRRLNETVHRLSYMYNMYPYRPFFLPSGGWGISIESFSQN